MAWLEGWAYRKSHIINYATNAGTNYPMRFKVYYGSGTDGTETIGSFIVGKVYCGEKCRTDFGDIRFTDDDGETLLDIWMDPLTFVSGVSAEYYIEVKDSLETQNQTVYIYYGKADATYPYLASEKAHGEATFIFFENLEGLNLGDILNQNNWTNANTTYEVQNTIVKEGTQALQSIGGGTSGQAKHAVTVETFKVFVLWYTRANNLEGFTAQIYLMENNTQITAVGLMIDNKKHLISPPAWQTIESAVVNTWYKIQLALSSISTHKVWIADVEKSLGSTANINNVVSAVNKIMVENYETATDRIGYWDLIIVGKFVTPEPAHSTWGEEESLVAVKSSNSIVVQAIMLEMI